MRKLSEWAWFIGLESILSLYILGIILAMRSNTSFQESQIFPIVISILVVVFMFLIWMMFSGREEKETVRGKG